MTQYDVQYRCKCGKCYHLDKDSCPRRQEQVDFKKIIEKNKLLRELLVEQRSLMEIDVESLKKLRKSILQLAAIDYGAFNKCIETIDKIIENTPE